MPHLDITWDSAKAQCNIAKHGVSFVQAASVLLNPLAQTLFDAAHSQVGQRWFSLGMPMMARRWRYHARTSPPGHPVQVRA